MYQNRKRSNDRKGNAVIWKKERVAISKKTSTAFPILVKLALYGRTHRNIGLMKVAEFGNSLIRI
jgi:hypothetical protein